MSEKKVFLITDSFANECPTHFVEYFALKLSESELTRIVYELAPLASQVENLGGGGASSVRASIGEPLLIGTTPSMIDQRYAEFEESFEDEDAVSLLEFINDDADEFKLSAGGFQQLIRPSSRDRMSVSFSEKHGPEIECGSSVIPTEVLQFLSQSKGNIDALKSKDPNRPAFCKKAGDWVILVG